MKNLINITKNAGIKLIEMSKTYNTDKILFYVKGGGCNGFGYKFKPFFEKPDKLDEIVKYEDINIVVCNNSLMYVLGTTIDYENDIMGSTFKFDNPNAGSKCGCGTSFSPKL